VLTDLTILTFSLAGGKDHNIMQKGEEVEEPYTYFVFNVLSDLLFRS